MDITDLIYIRYDYWNEAFQEGRRLGLNKDGTYIPSVDMDCFLMYCMI